jgi:hypothetical protein
MEQIDATKIREEWFNSPLYNYHQEKGDGKAWQATVTRGMMKNGLARRMALKIADQTSRRMKALPKAEQIRRASIGGTHMQLKLRSNPELKQQHYTKHAELIKEWNQNNPELSKQRKDAAADGLAKWREENPELAKAQWAKANAAAVAHIKKYETWRKANGISKELALWKKGLDVAHAKLRSDEFKQSEEGIAMRDAASARLAEARKDPEFNNKIKESFKNSEAKRKSELENLKKAAAVVYANVTCPHCAKEGSKRIMTRWHFDNCKYKI